VIDLIFTEAISCELVKSCASDLDVVNAARISVDIEHEIFDINDEHLIPYLLRKKHGSPFEHGYFKFRVEAPIFVFREHHRHRAGHSYNEMSGRYTELEPKFYVPRCARTQEGKPGHYVYVEHPDDSLMSRRMRYDVQEAYEHSWRAYQRMLKDGVAKEQARIVLPVGIFSKMIWSCNPRSLMHFLALRNAPTAQAEIRVVAEQAEKALDQAMPVTYEAFTKYGRVAP
jgi:thymidylate synthase (FAD)